ncbi:MAG TPA: thiamine phosphate synthase [Thermomicrobiales bacterium]|nr:thiamine phosphate synthase [Thermomicrobiales bacterium]
MSDLAPRLRRYLVTDARAGSVERLVEICRAALDGGVTAIQLRAKGWTDQQLLDAALALAPLCRDAGALFLVNDRLDIALASGADGIHLGVDDLPVAAARRLLGPVAIIGYSPEGDDDRLGAEAAGADYLGVGPVYGTGTKLDAGDAIGLDGLRSVVDQTQLPVIGIGGITIERAAEVVATGAVGVAIVGAVFMASDPASAARNLREVLP